MHPRYRSWKPEELELLDKLSDEEVAEKTGRSVSSVSQKRWKLGRKECGERGA